MDTGFLKSALESIVVDGFAKKANSKNQRATLLEQVSIRSDLAYELSTVLGSVPEIQGKMLRDGSGSTNLAVSLANGLVFKTLEKNPEFAINWLKRILSTSAASTIEILPLWGLIVESRINLFENIELIPFEALPPSQQKTSLGSPGIRERSRGPYAWSPPTSALVTKRTIDPLSAPDTEFLLSSARLHEIRLCLSAATISTIVPSFSWHQYEDSDFQDAVLGVSSTSYAMEIQPIGLHAFGKFSVETAQKIVSNYFSIEGSDRSRIRIALDRFDRAMRRHSPVDSAVELAIALDSLLGDQGTELTYRISLRSALLTDGAKEDRLHVRRIVRAVYGLRSDVVHLGASPAEYDVRGIGRMPTNELIKLASIATAGVIQAVINKGRLPDWFEAELGY